ncbi:MAG TPA: N-acetylmuramoyl-L-alanine amidase [Gaiellaceae bacterium]|nr:N-acetylmuramoyl-L-alanine amidase [Gaiellaceae bacterium]
MRRLLLLIAALLAGLSAAPGALASSNVTTVDLTPSGTNTFELRDAASRFTLAGVHWRGSGDVQLRTRSTSGRWSAWRAGAPEDEDGPDAGASERSPRGWRVGNPWWVGESNRIQARAVGNVTRVRAHLVWSPETRIPLRVPSATVAPPIVPRSSWSADERIRRGPPSYAAEVRFAIVHHTAGRNGYTRAEAAAIVKGIQLFHVQGNGWNDIGYNYLVDRFGTIYEGRFGGVDRNVIGAHAQGFNTGSVGVALLGTYGGTAPSAAAQDAIARLIAWRLDVAHVDPTSFLTFVSGGSDRYASGIPVLLGAISGHRDTGYTACPGDALHTRLGAIASTARAAGGLKIFEPRAEATGSAMRVRARLSQAQPWVARIASADGAEVARGTGSGTAVDWTWESAGAAAGSYSWTVSAGAARPATGILRAGGGALPIAIEALSAEPEAISPNDDGQADSTTITYRISAPANVSIEITDAIGGVVATVVDRVWTRAGQHAVTIDGAALADGDYNVVVTARSAAGLSVQKVTPLTVNRTLGFVTVTPAVFSPNGDGRKDRVTLTFALTAPADVRVRVERDGRWVASPLSGSYLVGTHRLAWDGARATGVLRDGELRAVVEATSPAGVIAHGVPFASDTVAPRVRILPGKALRVEVSEPSTLTFVIDGKAHRREVRRAGVTRIPWPGSADRVRVVAWDAAGNSSGPVVRIRRTD